MTREAPSADDTDDDVVSSRRPGACCAGSSRAATSSASAAPARASRCVFATLTQHRGGEARRPVCCATHVPLDSIRRSSRSARDSARDDPIIAPCVRAQGRSASLKPHPRRCTELLSRTAHYPPLRVAASPLRVTPLSGPSVGAPLPPPVCARGDLLGPPAPPSTAGAPRGDRSSQHLGDADVSGGGADAPSQTFVVANLYAPGAPFVPPLRPGGRKRGRGAADDDDGGGGGDEARAPN